MTADTAHSSTAKTVQLLQKILAPLQHISAELPQQAQDYILNGQSLEILSFLQQQADEKAFSLLDYPAADYRYTAQWSKKIEKQIEKAATARIELYEHLFRYFSLEQIERWGHFLVALAQDQPNYFMRYDALPPQLNVILQDSFDRCWQNEYYVPIQRQDWTFQQLAALFEHVENGSTRHLFNLFFQHLNFGGTYSIFKCWLNFQDTEAFFTQHFPQIRTLLFQENDDEFANETLLTIFQVFPSLRQQHIDLLAKLYLSKHKKNQQAALQQLLELPNPQQIELLLPYLQHGDAKQKKKVIDHFIRLGKDSQSFLENALQNETVKSTITALENALKNIQVAEKTENISLDIQAFTPQASQNLPEDALEQLLIENCQQRLSHIQKLRQKEIDNYGLNPDVYQDHLYEIQRLSALKPEHFKSLVALINGADLDDEFALYSQDLMYWKKKIYTFPEFSLTHYLRINRFTANDRDDVYWRWFFWFAPKALYCHLDLRQFAVHLKEAGYEHAEFLLARNILGGDDCNLENYLIDIQQVVPFLMTHLNFLEEALEIISPQFNHLDLYYQLKKSQALKYLKLFPELPQQFILPLLQNALATQKSYRQISQEILSKVPNIHNRVIEALTDSKQEIRATAAEWLGNLQHEEITPALLQAIGIEKKEIVYASLLNALEKQGYDIQSFISEETLLNNAIKALKAKISSSFTWFDLSTLPVCAWQNGTAVDARIIQYWVILAEKLKDPIPNPLFIRYLNLLYPQSQSILSTFLLQSFIEYDSRCYSFAEATAIAEEKAPDRLQSMQQMYQRYPSEYTEFAHYTLNDMINRIRNDYMRMVVGSATKSKGILALSYLADGQTAVKLLRHYCKNFYYCTTQIDYMLNALSYSDDANIIQLLMEISRAYRTNSIQEKAKVLLKQIADRLNWSADQLRDRTIPTAGMDASGKISLSYGEREFEAYLNEKNEFILKNIETAKVVKSLPTARPTDDAVILKEVKNYFNQCKKELKTTLSDQRQYLYENMCRERVWSAQDWITYLYQHPIVHGLTQKLLWIEHYTDGQSRIFRPSEDQCLLDLNDDEIQLNMDSQIQIAHACLITETERLACLQHLQDYKITPLFEQFTHLFPQLDQNSLNHQEITDAQGIQLNFSTIKDHLKSLGYQTSSFDVQVRDGLYLPLDSHEIKACIYTSPNQSQEQNQPVVLHKLNFQKHHRFATPDETIAIEDVPQIFVAECYAHFQQLAAQGQYMENWQDYFE